MQKEAALSCSDNSCSRGLPIIILEVSNLHQHNYSDR